MFKCQLSWLVISCFLLSVPFVLFLFVSPLLEPLKASNRRESDWPDEQLSHQTIMSSLIICRDKMDPGWSSVSVTCDYATRILPSLQPFVQGWCAGERMLPTGMLSPGLILKWLNRQGVKGSFYFQLQSLNSIYPSFYSMKQTGCFYFGNTEQPRGTRGLKLFSLRWNIRHMTS